jgi:hypothetical protein
MKTYMHFCAWKCLRGESIVFFLPWVLPVTLFSFLKQCDSEWKSTIDNKLQNVKSIFHLCRYSIWAKHTQRKSVLIFWAVTPCGLVVRYQRFSHDDGGSMLLWNIRIYLQVLTTLQPKDQHRHLCHHESLTSHREEVRAPDMTKNILYMAEPQACVSQLLLTLVWLIQSDCFNRTQFSSFLIYTVSQWHPLGQTMPEMTGDAFYHFYPQ